ncbi:hypothetical protein [Acidaminobacter hydrogenoformans]|uniref:Uncharacterized protein n=1 Tax=Acidaminobacter hydrogenoformans DSM 2784 TaxID=1120920 RepID=A0A1G5S2I4_9FIRM|nr:hypothetical protein [Acidaminobacter hydrogenoformans]SCZ80060.1 hypothetical protein SAMN03080599_02082 [Acidaminobacter hydrogenoformans DSM 2784]
MMIRYREWIILLPIVGLGILTANFVGYKTSFIESLPGVLILLGITLLAVAASKIIPIKLPVVAYCSLIGMLLASPISPVSGAILNYASKVNFAAPLTIVGAFAGISIGNEVKTFAKQGWKMIVIGLLVMTGTFIASATISHYVLKFTNVI